MKENTSAESLQFFYINHMPPIQNKVHYLHRS